jgi:uncharacterized protein YbaA (DUF1428 family)
MRYVDGYLLPVPKKSLKAYARMARKAGQPAKRWSSRSSCSNPKRIATLSTARS